LLHVDLHGPPLFPHVTISIDFHNPSPWHQENQFSTLYRMFFRHPKSIIYILVRFCFPPFVQAGPCSYKMFWAFFLRQGGFPVVRARICCPFLPLLDGLYTTGFFSFTPLSITLLPPWRNRHLSWRSSPATVRHPCGGLDHFFSLMVPSSPVLGTFVLFPPPLCHGTLQKKVSFFLWFFRPGGPPSKSSLFRWQRAFVYFLQITVSSFLFLQRRPFSFFFLS